MSDDELPRARANEPVLAVRGLRVSFDVRGERIEAVDGLDFDLLAGRTLAMVGESGSGKSSCVNAVLRLFGPEARASVSGSVRLDGRELLGLSADDMRAVRGREIAAVFQEPMTALNPCLSIGEQIVDAVRIAERLDRRAARARSIDLLAKVRMQDPERVVDLFPHQCSGGMRQRALIAMAISCGPRVLLADEPTSALDKTLEREIVDLVRDLRREKEMAVLWITHDLRVAAACADRVLVVYAGRVVEEASADELFAHPRHPYTRALVEARPAAGSRGARFAAIPGPIPDARAWPPGCRFHTRCPISRSECAELAPESLLAPLAAARSADGPERIRHRVACPYAEEEARP